MTVKNRPNNRLLWSIFVRVYVSSYNIKPRELNMNSCLSFPLTQVHLIFTSHRTFLQFYSLRTFINECEGDVMRTNCKMCKVTKQRMKHLHFIRTSNCTKYENVQYVY